MHYLRGCTNCAITCAPQAHFPVNKEKELKLSRHSHTFKRECARKTCDTRRRGVHGPHARKRELAEVARRDRRVCMILLSNKIVHRVVRSSSQCVQSCLCAKTGTLPLEVEFKANCTLRPRVTLKLHISIAKLQHSRERRVNDVSA